VPKAAKSGKMQKIMKLQIIIYQQITMRQRYLFCGNKRGYISKKYHKSDL